MVSGGIAARGAALGALGTPRFGRTAANIDRMFQRWEK